MKTTKRGSVPLHCSASAPRRWYAKAARRGATVLEVMFAIFVVIVGLLGIASLIPLASRNADQSNAYSVALTQGKVWSNDFFARRFNESGSFSQNASGYNWQWVNDTAGYAPPGLAPGYFNFSKIYGPAVAASGFNASPTGSAVTSSSPPGQRLWAHQAVCIDPLFLSGTNVSARIAQEASVPGSSRPAAYRAAVFPYFEDGCNPVNDAFNTSPPVAAWPDQPRMLRVTLGLDDDLAGVSSSLRMANKLINDVFVSKDDLAVSIDDSDKTLPATRIFSFGGAKAQNTGDYSWMVTLVPEEVRTSNLVLKNGLTLAGAATTASPSVNVPTKSYTVTVIIFRKRDREFVGIDTAAGSNKNKPEGERLTWVVPLSGNFIGGNGGRVRLISSAASDDSVSVGDWILLNKHYAIDDSVTTPATAPHHYSRFRWYRVIAIDSETRVDLLQNVSPTGADPYGNGANAPVWSRDVVLEGADWDFTGGDISAPYTSPISGTSYVTPTTGALMKNVVTVIEQKVTSIE